MFVIPADYEHDAANLKTYAERHSMATVLANFGGPSGGLPSAGCSAIWSEKGDPLARLDAAGAGIVVAFEGDGGWEAKAIMLDRVAKGT
jgi:hypothetical protein